MKKILSILLVLTMTLGITAQPNYRNHKVAPAQQPSASVSLASLRKDAPFGSREVATPLIEASLNSMGYYACENNVYIDFPDDNTIAITNLQGYGTTITGSYNQKTREIRIPHQLFYKTTMEEYDADLDKYFPIEVEMYFDPDSGVVDGYVSGKILDDGSLQLGRWIAETYFEADEAWDWMYNFDMQSTILVKPNATMTTTDVQDNTHNYNVFVKNESDKVTIFGFAGKAAIEVQKRSNGLIFVNPQQYFYFYNFYYGYASIYSPIYNGTELDGLNRLRYINGNGTDKTLTISAWAVTYDMGFVCPRDPEWLTTTTTVTLQDGSGISFDYPEAADYGFKGAGTEADPYLLASVSDFEKLGEYVQLGEYFNGRYFRMTNDIDFRGSDFKGIATGMSTSRDDCPNFGGTLDGDGHRIRNLIINQPTSNHIALFGELRGSVKNLIIDRSCSFIGYDYVGSIAGEIKYSFECTISNCRNYANVSGVDAYVGGLIGASANNNVIINCYNRGSVITNNCKVGGIVGYLFRSNVINCQNDGAVTILDLHPDNAPILQQAGGIAGYVCGATIDNCLNTGTVMGAAKVGGICGEIYNNVYETVISNTLNVGGVVCDERSQRGAIVAYCTSTDSHTDNSYYDADKCYYPAWGIESRQGFTAATTQQLISGSVALPSDYWDIKKGMYPALKSFTAEGQDWRSCYVLFSEGESAGNFHTTAQLNCDYGYLAGDGMTGFTLTDDVTLSAPGTDDVADDILTIVTGSYETIIPLRQPSSATLAGSGTQTDPYVIASVRDWNIFADMANSYSETFHGAYISVNADIDFQDADIDIPYQDRAVAFQGTLLGNGHTFSNMLINLGSSAQQSTCNQGLISIIGEHATVKDLNIASSAFIGYETIGAFAGTLLGTLDHCQTMKDVIVSVHSRQAGGLVGEIDDAGKVIGCVNRARVQGIQFLGGIAAKAESEDIVISNTANYGSVTNIQEEVAGISNVAGFVPRFSGTMTDCQNYGEISSYNDYASGFVTFALRSASFTRCFNHGNVHAAATNAVMGYAAGIVCEQSNKSVISDCGNTGRIKSGLNYAAGIVSLCNGRVRDSWNTGMVTSKVVFAGGICAYTGSSSTVSDPMFLHCWNTGEVAAGYEPEPARENDYAGGIVGSTIEYSPVLVECWNSGYIHVDKFPGDDGNEDYDPEWDFTNAGGLVGGGAPVIESCMNMGKVWSRKQTGGLVALLTNYSNARISHSYNAGEVSASDGDATYASHILGDEFLPGVVDNATVFYDVDADDNYYALDRNFSALSREEMLASDGTILALGNAFDSSAPATYPQLSYYAYNPEETDTVRILSQLSHAVACASLYETEQDGVFRLGMADLLQWHGDGVRIENGYAYGTALGQATLTVSHPSIGFTKTFSVEVVDVPAPGNITIDDITSLISDYLSADTKVTIDDITALISKYLAQ